MFRQRFQQSFKPVQHLCQQFRTPHMCTAALLQRRNDCMQFRRQGDSCLPDIDADANNHIIHSAIFTVPRCFCQNSAEFFPLIENIIHPFNLYRQLIQGFYRLCNGNCCAIGIINPFRKRIEKYSPVLTGEQNGRPIRPRPADCPSAATTVPCTA